MPKGIFWVEATSNCKVLPLTYHPARLSVYWILTWKQMSKQKSVTVHRKLSVSRVFFQTGCHVVITPRYSSKQIPQLPPSFLADPWEKPPDCIMLATIYSPGDCGLWIFTCWCLISQIGCLIYLLFLVLPLWPNHGVAPGKLLSHFNSLCNETFSSSELGSLRFCDSINRSHTF